jgi:hypothetical protein
MWALSWGISEGITSGVVDLLGAKLLLFDAAVYPGFSGGPVVMLDASHRPVVVGVNHAILFMGGLVPVASISSAASAADIREALAKKPAPIEAKLAEFVQQRNAEPRAQLFITSQLSVNRDTQLLTTAAIVGNEKTIETSSDDVARVPVVAMMFALEKGKHDVVFDLLDPSEKVVGTVSKTITVGEHDRVSFASADFRFDPQVAGRFEVLTKVGGKPIGRRKVWIENPDDDDQPVDEGDQHSSTTGQPHVDVVVASYGREDPFALSGIRANWVEWRYPRRVEFTWFARGSRGWSGSNVAISAFVLDEKGKIVGRGVGCVRPEVRPEQSWSCAGQGGSPLVTKEGRYDVVFAMNDRPVAAWPMEAMVRTNNGASTLEKWMQNAKSQPRKRRHKGSTTSPKPPTPSAPSK